MQFARFAHGHDYSDMWFFPSYGPASHNPSKDDCDPSKLSCCGTFNVVKYFPGVESQAYNELSVWQPTSSSSIEVMSTYSRYKVGDL